MQYCFAPRKVMSQKIKIYHNPACGTSRNTLELIRNTGQEPEVIEYLQTPPSKEELITLIEKSELSVREAIRKNVEPYEKLELAQEHWTDDQLINFMLEYPILINRPFVGTDIGIKLCRPSELVLDLLSAPQLNAFSKEDGEAIIDQDGNRIK
jgi:arsenate reductase